jgi:hypothetical protein
LKVDIDKSSLPEVTVVDGADVAVVDSALVAVVDSALVAVVLSADVAVVDPSVIKNTGVVICYIGKESYQYV